MTVRHDKVTFKIQCSQLICFLKKYVIAVMIMISFSPYRIIKFFCWHVQGQTFLAVKFLKTKLHIET